MKDLSLFHQFCYFFFLLSFIRIGIYLPQLRQIIINKWTLGALSRDLCNIPKRNEKNNFHQKEKKPSLNEIGKRGDHIH